jgi:pimeloyl-ACP methyl ester carboxylesterase
MAGLFPALPDPVPGSGPLPLRILGAGGPTIVLVHGLGRVAATWALVARALEGRGRLVLPDNPGLGRALHLRVPATIEEHAELLVQSLDAADLQGPLHLAGLSLGGMIAPAAAARLGPGRCASLTVLSSSSRETGFWRLDPRALLRVAARALWTVSLDHRVNLPELVRPEILAAHPELPDELRRLQLAEGFRLSAGLRQLVAAARFRLRRHIQWLPTRRLVVVGSQDRLVPPRHSERLAELLRAPLWVLEGAGHDLGIDAPDEVARALLAAAGDEPLGPSREPPCGTRTGSPAARTGDAQRGSRTPKP